MIVGSGEGTGYERDATGCEKGVVYLTEGMERSSGKNNGRGETRLGNRRKMLGEGRQLRDTLSADYSPNVQHDTPLTPRHAMEGPPIVEPIPSPSVSRSTSPQLVPSGVFSISPSATPPPATRLSTTVLIGIFVSLGVVISITLIVCIVVFRRRDQRRELYDDGGQVVVAHHWTELDDISTTGRR